MNQGAMNSQSKIIAQCSAGTTALDNDITCYTSVAQVKFVLNLIDSCLTLDLT